MKGVSIIIPCYNRENTIKEAVESILTQSYYGDYEIIISDDGSTDNSLSIITGLSDKIRIIRKPVDCFTQGAAGARNRGIKVAKYEYIAFLDSDDYYLPDYLNSVSKVLDENPHFGYAFCRAKMAMKDMSGNLILTDWTRKRLSRLDKKYHVLFRAFNINTNVIMIRKSLIDEVGLFDINLLLGEDSDLWIRLSYYSIGTFVDIYGSVYRFTSNNQLTESFKDLSKRYAIKLNLKHIERILMSKNRDKLSLYLAYRTILFLSLDNKIAILRRIKVVCCSLFLFPFQYIKFLYNVARK